MKGTKLVLNCFSGPFREIPRILSKSSNELMHDSFEYSQVVGFFVGISNPKATLEFPLKVTALLSLSQLDLRLLVASASRC